MATLREKQANGALGKPFACFFQDKLTHCVWPFVSGLNFFEEATFWVSVLFCQSDRSPFSDLMLHQLFAQAIEIRLTPFNLGRYAVVEAFSRDNVLRKCFSCPSSDG